VKISWKKAHLGGGRCAPALPFGHSAFGGTGLRCAAPTQCSQGALSRPHAPCYDEGGTARMRCTMSPVHVHLILPRFLSKDGVGSQARRTLFLLPHEEIFPNGGGRLHAFLGMLWAPGRRIGLCWRAPRAPFQGPGRGAGARDVLVLPCPSFWPPCVKRTHAVASSPVVRTANAAKRFCRARMRRCRAAGLRVS